MKKYLYMFTVLSLNTLCVTAQNGVTMNGKYLGQKPPGMEPELFAPGIISTRYYEHSAPAFSPDGNIVLWTVIYERGKPAQLLEMRQVNGVWSKPAIPTFADTTADDFYPTFSADGNKLFFNSRRKVPVGYKDAGLRIWEVQKTSSGWGTPVPFDTVVSAGEDYAMSIAGNGDIYFAVRRANGHVFDIVTSKWNGNQHLKPKTLPYNINTMGSEDGACIAPDGSYLIFESSRAGSMDGSTDLYISFKQKNGGWGRAKNMGSTINSKFTERFPKLSPDGKYLFFGSDRQQAPDAFGTDVYWVDAKVIAELRKTDAKENEHADNNGHEILNTLYNREIDKSTVLLKQWLQTYPTDEDAFVEYVSLLRRNNQLNEAHDVIMARGNTLPDNVDMKIEVALVMYEMNKHEEAEKYILSQLGSGPQDRYRYNQLAFQLYQLKKYPQSAAIYEAALKIQPSGPDYYNMACCWALSGNSDKAFEALNNAADHGYNTRHDFENDADLARLKADNRWERLMKKLDEANK